MPNVVISDQCKSKLDGLKKHPRATYLEVIEGLISDKENPSFEEAIKETKEIHKQPVDLEEIPQNIK